MDIKKKTLLVGAGVAVFIIAFSLFAFTDIFRGYDAAGYVRAVLEQKFQGKVDTLQEFTGEATKEALYKQYEDEIISYVDSNLLSNVEAEQQYREKYIDLTKKIFSAMKYEVGEAEKVNSKVYQVTVTYQATDVLSKFMVLLGEDQRLNDKSNRGEYQEGDQADIALQMQRELLENSCALLEQAYETMEFGEKQTMIFTIEKDDDGLYKMRAEEIMEFVEKITGIDG